MLVLLVVVTKYSNHAAQQDRTKSIVWRLWHPLHSSCIILEHSLQPAVISGMLGFAEGGKPGNLLKVPSKQSREPTQSQPTSGNPYRNRTWATMVGGECSHHCANSASLLGGLFFSENNFLAFIIFIYISIFHPKKQPQYMQKFSDLELQGVNRPVSKIPYYSLFQLQHFA